MERCCVLIVGGGPAGSTCARSLRRAGLDVLVVDRATFPRDKTCAGWITPAVVEELELDLREYARGRVLQPFHGFAVSLRGGDEAAIDYGRPVSYGIRRFEFDHYLLERSGARLRLGAGAEKFERRGERWIVNGEIEADLVVGAGGHFCPVARFLGDERAEGESAIVAQEVEFHESGPASPSPVAPEIPSLSFCRDLRGYAWVVRKGDWWNVGLGRQDPRRLSSHVGSFVGELAAKGVVPRSTPRRFSGHAYFLYEAPPHRRIVADGMLLLGDAAGLAYRQSGEGIRTAVESALLAARTIVEAAPDFRRARLERYRAALVERLGGPDRFGWTRVGSLIPQRLGTRVAQALLSSSWFARHVVLDRWFFHTGQEPLVF
jgi:flavin-dependent dehydrogenase